MTYPPQPGPPGADGWPGGDPNQMPPADPYGAPGYPPPGQDPYGAPASGVPGQDPYGAPASGIPGQDPYGAPASGVPGSNPYSAPPGYGPPGGMPPGGMPPGMQPGMPQPSNNSNTGWIVGGVIGVVVILLVVVGVLFATGTFSGDDSPSADDGKGSEDASADDDGKDEGGNVDPGASETGEYKMVDKLCDAIDFSGLQGYADFEMDPTQSNSNYDGYSETNCDGYVGDILDDKYGSFYFKATTHETDNDAEDRFEYDTDPDYMTGCDSMDEREGSWTQGMVITASDTASSCYVGISEENTGLFVQDGNISLNLTLGFNGGMGDGKEADALADIAEQILAASAA